MVPANQIIHLSPRAFWDVDMSKMDYENNWAYIIRKVFERGSLEDVVETLAYYGDEKTKAALISAPSLRRQTVVFASKLFSIPLSSFRCYNTKPFHPIF